MIISPLFFVVFPMHCFFLCCALHMARAQWRRNRAVSAWTEWLLIAEIACVVGDFVAGPLLIPVWVTIVVSLVGMVKTARAESRRLAKRHAELQQELRLLDEDIVRLTQHCQAMQQSQKAQNDHE